MSNFIRPTVEIDEINDTVARVTVEPLERGFGDTLGNSMRRVLLSSLEGAAVESIRIDGVQHEFSSIEGVYEDVTDIVLNVKQLVFERVADIETATATINVEGPKVVCGADFLVPAGFNLINPDLVICHLEKGAHLTMEMVIGCGRGYVSGEENEDENDPIGVIHVDSLFSPIKRCAKSVEPCRVGQHTDFDRLILEIETNGAITPKQAIVEAADIINQHMAAFMSMAPTPQDADGEPVSIFTPEVEQVEPINNESIEALQLSVRSYNCLKRAGVETVGDLLNMSENELMHLRNFGVKSVDEVTEKLSEMGLSLKK